MIWPKGHRAPEGPKLAIKVWCGQFAPNLVPGWNCHNTNGGGSLFVVVTPSYRRTSDPEREYSDSCRLTRSRQNPLSSGFTPFRNQQISGQESPFFTIPGGFQEKTRIQGQKQDHL
ncbi:hypothetical protein O181_069662 [Austropuccinia psidii MF-1]|uniref:Uncharacterized protein n=1 Tax=Austropuccinia psidii MF-1 TaxID=1389203 RepID=A0A9Q3I7I1_9BASI|nr:hypothetical protein [Austropuccinia psidii MF-1]